MSSLPDHVFVQIDAGSRFVPAAHRSVSGVSTWTAAGTTVRIEPNGTDGHQVSVATVSGVSRVALRWRHQLPAQSLVLGDAWERSYGDLQWTGFRPDRLLPWYWLAHDQATGYSQGAGVEVQPGAFCAWTVQDDGATLWLDLRNGGSAVHPGDREIQAAVVRTFDTSGLSAWDALRVLVASLAPQPSGRRQPLVGANNWYYAYGEGFDKGAVLKDARNVVELADGHPVRPFSVVDDGWNPGGAGSGGPWDTGLPGVFDNMADTAAAIADVGARPGLWFRPLRSQEPVSGARTDDGFGRPLDPSHPDVLGRVTDDMRRFTSWGFELIKHDFSTNDLFGRYGFDMGFEMTEPGWQLHDISRTNAEVLVDFYGAIREAAGSAVILGCNTVGHLAAGLVDAQRTGDDTSGRRWERTRRMGINTLAFRLSQHGTFFTVDADCVPCTPETDWALNSQFLDLVARSGTALFVSVDPVARNADTDADLSAGIRLALDGGLPGRSEDPTRMIEAVDFLTSAVPASWRFGSEQWSYDWNEPLGAYPGRC